MAWDEVNFGITVTLSCNGDNLDLITGEVITFGATSVLVAGLSTTIRPTAGLMGIHSPVMYGAFAVNNKVTAPAGSQYVQTDANKVFTNTTGAKVWAETIDAN